MAAALCIPSGLVLAQASSSAHVLPSGTPLDFIADDTINIESVRPGGQYKVHLVKDLILDGTPLASAGTSARLVVTAKTKTASGTSLRIALDNFKLKAGELPVAPIVPDVSVMVAGTDIAARTIGLVERTPDRIVIRVPVPFALSTDKPSSFFTPLPARTQGPIVPPSPRPRRGATPAPDATPITSSDPDVIVTASPDAAPSASPAASASP